MGAKMDILTKIFLKKVKICLDSVLYVIYSTSMGYFPPSSSHRRTYGSGEKYSFLVTVLFVYTTQTDLDYDH